MNYASKNKRIRMEGAIEKLFNNFGRSLLVPDEHYIAVNNFINKTRLKGKLVYFRMIENDITAMLSQVHLTPSSIS